MTVKIRFIFYFLYIAGCLLYGMAETFFLFLFYSSKCKLHAIQLWSPCVFVSCGIKLQTSGTSPQEGRGQMLTSNHISRSDIMAANGAFPGRLVVKDDVTKWPVVGYLVTQAQAVYVPRNRDIKGNSARIAGVAEAPKNGDTIAIFPEGTNTEGREILPFKPGFSQMAYDAGISTIPALCRYPNPDGNSPNSHTAYYGDISLRQSICMAISQSSSTVELHFLDPIEVGEDRYAIALQVHALLGEKQKQLG